MPTTVTVTGALSVTNGLAGNGSLLTNLDAGNISTGTLSVTRGGTGLGAATQNGQLLIGNGTGYTLNTLTAGTNITITNSAGGITIDASSGAVGANTSLSNLTATAINQTLQPGGAGIDLGSNSFPFATLYLGSGANNVALNTTTTAARTIALPDASGTVCLQNAAACGFATSSGSGNYVQNQIASQQTTANYWIAGTGRADTSILTPALDTATAAPLSIGSASATAVNIGKPSTTTTVSGTLNSAGDTTLGTTGSSQFTNNSSTVNTALAIANKPSGGSIGTAAATVDVYTSFTVNQTTGSQTLTLPNPTNTVAGRIAYVSNIGTNSFTMYATTVASANSQAYIWNGSAWTTTSVSGSGSGVSTVGTIDSQTPSADGAVISGASIYLQSASATNPGLVNTTAQTLAGDKTFTGNTSLFKNTADSTTAFQIQTAAGTALLTADTTNQGITFQSGNDFLTLGSELYSGDFSTNWTTTNWTLGGGNTTATHNTGNTSALTNTGVAITSGAKYQVSFTLAGSCGTASDTVTATIGGQTLSGAAITGTTCSGVNTYVVTTTNTNKLAFTPISTWLGTISAISIKELTGTINPVLTVKNSAGTANIEVRASSSTGNMFMGINSGSNNTTGNNNTATGNYSLRDNTTGNQNTAFGTFSLQSNTTGSQNTATGAYGLQYNTTGSRNTASGFQSLRLNTTGYDNTASGYQSLRANTTGSSNTAYGSSSLQANTTGYQNNAIGNFALQNNTTGTRNTAIGYSVLNVNTTGSLNTAIGLSALGSNSSGSQNIAIGWQTMFANTTGGNNLALSSDSLGSNTTGGSNIALGTGALGTNTTGSYNVGIGDSVRVLSNNLNNATAIGASAKVGGSNSVVLGRASGFGTGDAVGVNTVLPTAVANTAFQVGNGTYATGSICQNTAACGVAGSTTTTVTGVSTTFTANMVGGTLLYSDGTTATITAFGSTTSLTVSVSKYIETATTYTIIYPGGYNVSNTGAVTARNLNNSTTAYQIQNASGTALFTADTTNSKLIANGSLVANASATATTATTSGTGTNTTTLTFSGTTSFANGDVILIDNAGQDYYTRITAGGNAASVTIDPAVTFETGRTVTKYNIQNIGATTTDYTTQSNRFFQGYFTGGIVTGAGSTTFSDASIKSSNNLKITTATGVNVQGTANSTTAFQVQNTAGTSNTLVADTTNNRVGIGVVPTTTLQVAGNALFKNTADSTTAFAVQNSAGSSIFNVDTTNKAVNFGVAATYNTYTPGASFAAAVNYTSITSSNSGVATADFNNDTFNDVVTTGYSGGAVASVFINNGDATFAAKVDYTTGASPAGVTTSDVNKDGYQDIIIANFVGSSTSVLINNGNGTFATKVDYTVGANAWDVVSRDVNNDTWPDLIVPSSSKASVFINNGNGTFATKVDYTVTGASNIYSLTAADYNQDGYVDIATTRFNQGNISVLLNNGNGSFASSINYNIAGVEAHDIVSSDVNNDTYPDLITANYQNNTLSVLINNGNGTFAASVDYSCGSDCYTVTTGDYNNDTYPDIAYGGFNMFTYVRMNNGNGTFGSATQITTGHGRVSLASADFNNDGKIDIASANGWSSNINQMSISLNGATLLTVNANISTTAVSANTAALILQGATSQAVDIFRIQDSSGTNTLFNVTNNGNVGLGLNNPDHKLDVNGSINARADLYVGSIKRIDSAGNLSNINNVTANGNSLFKTTTNSTTAFQIQNTAGTSLLTADTTGMQVTVSKLEVTGNLTVNGHIITGGSTPIIAAGAAACTSPTVAVTGNDSAGSISITTGTGCAATGVLGTITFNTAYGAAPKVSLTPTNANAVNLKYYNGSSTTANFTLDTTVAPTDATVYTYSYLIAQ